MFDVSRRQVLHYGALLGVATISRLSSASEAAYRPAVPGRPIPGESPFGFESTAEAVTVGLDLTGRTALVTGCNSGLGYETMRVLALRGAHDSQASGYADTQRGHNGTAATGACIRP